MMLGPAGWLRRGVWEPTELGTGSKRDGSINPQDGAGEMAPFQERLLHMNEGPRVWIASALDKLGLALLPVIQHL